MTDGLGFSFVQHLEFLKQKVGDGYRFVRGEPRLGRAQLNHFRPRHLANTFNTDTRNIKS